MVIMNEQIRIAILDQNDVLQTYMDNYNDDSMTFFGDTLHEYLEGTAATFSFTSLSEHPDSKYLVVGNKLAFVNKGKDYYFNIQIAERDNNVVFVEAYSLSFELLNEQTGKYTAPRAMSFAEYVDVFDYENVLTLGLNEVSDKAIAYEWTGESTLLARLFSLSYLFSSEIEFVPTLNSDYSLQKITLNIYKENSDNNQGVGLDRSDTVLRYGVNIPGIRKKSDITDLYTCILMFGKNGLTLAGMDRSVTDPDGNKYFTSPGDGFLRAPNARDRFPSSTAKTNDRYVAYFATYDTDNIEVLWGESLYLLRKNCMPKVEYTVEGFVDAEVGDSIYMEDLEFDPALYLKARVSEQIRSFTNPSQNRTTFSNFKEEKSQVNVDLLAVMQNLVDSKKIYACSILSDNGTFFKNGLGTTTLTASVMDEGLDITNTLTVLWFKDNVQIASGASLTIQASSIIEKSVYRFEARSGAGVLFGQYEATVTNIEDSISITILSTGGDVFKNGSGSSDLIAKVYQAGVELDADGSLYTYTWTVMNENGNPSTFNDGSATKTGKTISVGDLDVSVKATFQVVIS